MYENTEKCIVGLCTDLRVTGLLLIVFLNSVSTMFDAAQSLRILGTGLPGCVCLMVFSEARRTSLNAKIVIIISTLDITWVEGSMTIVAFGLSTYLQPDIFSSPMVAAWVALTASSNYWH